MASKFEKNIPILVALTKAPIFVSMQQTRKAIPMKVGIWGDIVAMGLTAEECAAARTAINNLSWSKRYLEALIEPGAVRRDLRLRPAGPVSEGDIGHAKMKLAAKAKGRGKPASPVAIEPPKRQHTLHLKAPLAAK